MNVIVGAFSGQFLAVSGVATLFVLALALPIAAFQVLLGIAGTAVGLVVFVVIGDPSSGGRKAPQLLPGFWRAISQHLPPGAGVTAIATSSLRRARRNPRPGRAWRIRDRQCRRGDRHLQACAAAPAPAPPSRRPRALGGVAAA